MSAKVLWAIIGGFLFGVSARSLFDIPWPFAALLALLALLILAFGYFDRSKWKAAIVVTAAFAACGTGITRLDIAVQKADPHIAALVGEKVTVEGFVSAEPDVRERNVRLVADVDTTLSRKATTSVAARVMVIAPPHTEIKYGERIRATGELELPSSFDTDGGRQFDYPMFLAKDGTLFILSFAEIERIDGYAGNPLQATAIRAKEIFLDGLRAVLPEPSAGLAAGITVGDKRSVGSELSDVFQAVSLIHVIVLSGYNITIVINFLRLALGYVPRYIQYVVIGLAVLGIILMTGGAASAVRAGIMALIAVFARATGRLFYAARILGVVAAGMVFWNPYILAFDPGFQLSVLATLGLVLYTPIFANWFTWVTERFQLREILSSTIATQLMVLPLLLYQNGNLSIVALPANLLALVAVPIAMGASIFAAFAGMVFGSLAVPLALPAHILLSYIIKVAEVFASLPFASVSIAAFSFWWVIAAYAVIFVFYWYKKSSAGGEAPAERLTA